jgi:hypothetical protein
MVQLNTLLDDNLIDFKKIGVIKIDTQGSEMSVLRGGLRFFIAHRVPFIICEFWPPVLSQRGEDPVHLLQVWTQLGYSIRNAGWLNPVIEPANFSSLVRQILDRPPHFTDLFLTWQA